MSKIYLNVNLKVIVDTDVTSAEDIIDYLDFTPTSENEVVEVLDCEVDKFEVTDSK
jgi:hypothetical protein